MTSAITGELFLEVSVLQVSVEFFGRLQRSSQESGLTSDLLRDAEQLVLRPRQALEQVGEVRATPSLGVPADSTITHPRMQHNHTSTHAVHQLLTIYSVLLSLCMTYQQSIMREYSSLGQPGGGGRRQPVITIRTVCTPNQQPADDTMKHSCMHAKM